MTTSYSVTAPSLNATKVFGPGQYPYMFDVVELFVTFSETRIPLFSNSKYRRTTRTTK